MYSCKKLQKFGKSYVSTRGGGQAVAYFCLQWGEGVQNGQKCAYVILERPLTITNQEIHLKYNSLGSYLNTAKIIAVFFFHCLFSDFNIYFWNIKMIHFVSHTCISQNFKPINLCGCQQHGFL